MEKLKLIAFDGEDLRAEDRQQREREVAVGDRRPVRAGRGTLGIDVDPLVVAGGVGERVHAFLRDLEPIAVAEVLADSGFDLGDALEYAHVLDSCVVGAGGRQCSARVRVTR